MKKVPVLNFPNPATAVIKLPNARLARLLGDYFNTQGFNIKTTRKDGLLTLTMPHVSHDFKASDRQRMSELYSSFCAKNNLEIEIEDRPDVEVSA